MQTFQSDFVGSRNIGFLRPNSGLRPYSLSAGKQAQRNNKQGNTEMF